MSCRIDLKQAEPEATLFRRIELKGLNADDFETAQHFVSSRDGTRVPMFIVQKKGAERDGNNPTLLYGYGGAATSMSTPRPEAETALVRIPMCGRRESATL
jgi:prolyl oligopeptidase